ncbi:FtsJ-like methyltransferase-domain-containing protein [Microdochium bolleyi]|uniref:rRNA methyltransferase 2, mitochondrial n=1 Tax=Microdochium bolleyi TaxID=196109 RepID=A0A136J1L9_9PEZI|nr:FtsJ-like methyltransferase-domain-containing protein [Microdochium bolleyi]
MRLAARDGARAAARASSVVQPRAPARACSCSLLTHIDALRIASSPTLPILTTQTRWSSSNSRWKQRQGNDFYAREARVQGLKSRAAFKLLEMDARYKLFRRGQTVVDLGYAPGSWSQVALERTKPTGRVVGIDIIPAQPPRGVSTIQGNFLSPGVQIMVKEYLLEIAKRRGSGGDRQPRPPPVSSPETTAASDTSAEDGDSSAALPTTIVDHPSYIDTERSESLDSDDGDGTEASSEEEGRLVDVVLSDMSAPWMQTGGFSSRTLSNPYDRMMNTSGMSFRDHAGSMDLCHAALSFASDTLRAGGHFVCKFYQGAEDKLLENRLKKMFAKVHREKPDSSRTESREAFFVALRRKGDVTLSSIE